MMGKLLGSVEDFAAVTGETSDKAAEELNRMFSDPAKGAEELDKQLNLLTAAEQHEIENLEAQGRFGEAQQKLFEALSQRIEGATQELGFFASAWETVKKAASNAWDALGRIGKTPTIDEQIAALKEQIETGGMSAFTGLPGAGLPDSAIAKLKDELDALEAQKKALEHQAKQDQSAAESRELGKAYDELARKLDPLIGKHEELENQLGLVDEAFRNGLIGLEEWERQASALQTAIQSTLSPLDEAKKRLDILRQVDAEPVEQRGPLRAQLDAEFASRQNPATAGMAKQLGEVARTTAQEEQDTANSDAAMQAIKDATMQADAQDRLARAAGVSSAALKQAAIDNQLAAAAEKYDADTVEQLRQQLERAAAAQNAHEIDAEVLSLNQQADAAQRVADASSRGAGAVRQATIENQAFADALKVGAQGSKEFMEAYGRLLDVLQRKSAAESEVDVQKELRARQDSLSLAQLELSLSGAAAEKRSEEVALMREKLRLQEQFPGATQQEIDQLTTLSSQEGRIQAQIKERDQEQKELQQTAKQDIDTVINGIESMVTGAKNVKDAMTGIKDSLLKLGTDTFVNKPLSQFFDKQLSPGGMFGSGGGMAGMWDSLKGWFGFGGSGPNPASGPADATSDLGKLLGFGGGSLSGLTQTVATSTINVASASIVANGIGGGELGSVTDLAGANDNGSLDDLSAVTAPASDATDLISMLGFHSGGVVGRDGTARVVPFPPLAVARRFHSGGVAGLDNDEVPAILQTGERVLSRQEAASYGQGGVYAPLTIHITGRPTQDDYNQARRTAHQMHAQALDRAMAARSRTR
jgi:hypothetical protein